MQCRVREWKAARLKVVEEVPIALLNPFVPVPIRLASSLTGTQLWRALFCDD